MQRSDAICWNKQGLNSLIRGVSLLDAFDSLNILSGRREFIERRCCTELSKYCHLSPDFVNILTVDYRPNTTQRHSNHFKIFLIYSTVLVASSSLLKK